MANHFVTSSKASAMKFLDNMFEARGYNIDTKQVVLFKRKKLWEVFIEDGNGDKVMCVLTTVCSSNLDSMGIEEIKPEERSFENEEGKNLIFEGTKTNSGKNNTVGMDFIKSIITYGEKNNVKLVILVSDTVTSHAVRAISKANMQIVHFTYIETAISSMSKHINQPVVFRKLSILETKLLKAKNPMYQKTLQRYSHVDPLVKYFGMNIGDIVEYEDNDRQSGLVKEHGIVVQDL
jgi:hypothetical protein